MDRARRSPASNHLTGWPDGDPLGPFGTITDSLSPRFAAVAVTAALLRRARTGRGAYIDVSQVETGVYCLTEWLLAFQVSGESFGRVGNQSRRAVPHGVFPAAGADCWIAIATHSDADWRLLRRVMGDPDWASSPSLDVLAGRLEARPMIEDRIAEWTSNQVAADLAAELQSSGVDACAVLDVQEVLRDPQLAHRDHFRQLSHPVVGETCSRVIRCAIRVVADDLRPPCAVFGSRQRSCIRGIARHVARRDRRAHRGGRIGVVGSKPRMNTDRHGTAIALRGRAGCAGRSRQVWLRTAGTAGPTVDSALKRVEGASR